MLLHPANLLAKLTLVPIVYTGYIQ
uniref:Uncharacterized protein n=1 Tax=Anguilla anguilla TaxID=7936 RepID=A0A0E9VHR8_ANGAN